jgi:phage-related minor tail protein
MAASQNIARLGIVLGLDSGELVTKITEAQQKFGKFKAQIKRDSEDAAKEIVRLENATRNYGKTLTEVEKIEEQIRLGKYKNQPDLIINNLKAQAAAYDKVAAAAKAADQAKMGKMGGMTAQQQAALGYQTTDIITSLAGGQNPMMVLLQQGGQLRDQFGGFKPLFAGIVSAISPMMVAMTAAAASVTVFTTALYLGRSESEKFHNTMILTGRFAGITEGQFNSLSVAIKRDFGGTIGSAREVMDSLVASGQFTGKTLYSVGSAITKIASLSGESASDIAKNLIPALDGSASSAANLNKQYNFLTFAQYKQIETLNEQGKVQEAIRLTADALTESLTKQEQRVGSIEKSWKFLKEQVSGFWDWMKSIGRDETPMEKMLKAAEKYAEFARNPKWANTEVAKKALAEYEKYAAIVGAESKKAEDESIIKAKTAERIKLEERIGGNKKYRDIQKQIDDKIAESQYQTKAYGLEKIKQLEEKATFDIAKAKNEQERLIQDEGGVTRIQRMKLFVEQEKAINQQLARDKEDIYKESRNKFRDLAQSEQESIDRERERLQVYKQNILSSQQDLDIALSRLKTQQDLVDLNKQENMKDVDRQVAADRIKYLDKQRESVIMQREELKRLQDMNQSVFNNMGNAIDNFVRTGKLSFKDLTRSIITDLISIAMRAQMMSMFKGFSFFGGGGFKDVGGMGAASNNYLVSSGILGSAVGGPLSAGQPSIVGENGPELFVPRGAGTIVPNSGDLSGVNMAPQIVYNGPYIASMSAIDTQSSIQFLSKNKQAVWAANQSAQRSLPMSR